MQVKGLSLAHKQMETYGCVISNTVVAADALVQKHLGISIHSADWIFIALEKLYRYREQYRKKSFEQKIPSCLEANNPAAKADTKENIKVCVTRTPTAAGNQLIPLTKASNMETVSMS